MPTPAASPPACCRPRPDCHAHRPSARNCQQHLDLVSRRAVFRRLDLCARARALSRRALARRSRRALLHRVRPQNLLLAPRRRRIPGRLAAARRLRAPAAARRPGRTRGQASLRMWPSSLPISYSSKVIVFVAGAAFNIPSSPSRSPASSGFVVASPRAARKPLRASATSHRPSTMARKPPAPPCSPVCALATPSWRSTAGKISSDWSDLTQSLIMRAVAARA